MSTDTFALTELPASRPVPLRLHDWVTTVDHKRLGILYILFALVFLILGGVEATVMRMQLIRPHNGLVSPQVFNRMFTMHGTTMIFFAAMPLLFGFANYLVPIMIGARDMAFPRLNAFSFWMTALAGVFLYFSFVGGDGLYGAGSAPDVGWFAYAPLTSKTFSVGHSTDFWTLSLLVSGIGSVGTAINIITTIVCMRCPGMTLGKMPLMAWLSLIMAGLVILAISPLTAAQIMLLIDRYLGAHFFDTQAGGSAVIWMHFFWIFGHPEVYILVIPAFAFVSKIVPVFSRKAIFGYPIMVMATLAIGFISMSVWAHHMFTVGMTSAANTFFVLSTMAISVPTGIKIFNWLATIWGGKVRLATPMMFCIGFLFQFLIAGLTGITMGVAPLDWQLAGSYYLVAHFHYVIVGAILFASFGAFYYWFPKATGTDTSKWFNNEHRYADPEGKHIFAFIGAASNAQLAYNTKMVNAQEFKSYQDVLNPKWKGKIVSLDPRDAGLGATMQFWYYSPELGPEFIKKFFGGMENTYSKNFRQMTDWLAQGKFAICMGCKDSARAKNQGLPVDDFDTNHWREGSSFSAGGGSVGFLNQAPHPNAAKVFLNWFLSKKGQIALQKLGDVDDPANSRRIDIPKDDIPPDNRLQAGVKYFDVVKPEYGDMKPIFDLAREVMAVHEKK